LSTAPDDLRLPIYDYIGSSSTVIRKMSIKQKPIAAANSQSSVVEVNDCPSTRAMLLLSRESHHQEKQRGEPFSRSFFCFG